MEILKIEGLCKQYPAFSLKNVSFSMEAGTVMGFIGRNGAGKTTTLKSMLRLVLRMQVMWRSAGWTLRNRSWRSRHRSAS